MSHVYVLGAGFSKALYRHAPLNDELLSGICNLKLAEERVIPELYKAHKVFISFMNSFYPCAGTNGTVPLPRIEDVLSQLDYLIDQDRPLAPEYSVEMLRAIRNYVVYGIGAVLREHMESEENVAKARDFVRYLKHEDSIISLNYDIIIDSALLALNNRRCLINYSLKPRYIFRNRSRESYEDFFPSHIKLFKLHGSLNWLYCPRCRAIDVTVNEKGATYIYESRDLQDGSSRCPNCRVPYEPVIITPTFLKRYDNIYLMELWRDASKELETAEVVTFIGYSLADADMLLRCMFKEALYANCNKPRIEVVNYVNTTNGDNIKENLANLERYQRLFGEVAYDAYGLEAYIERGCEVNDDLSWIPDKAS